MEEEVHEVSPPNTARAMIESTVSPPSWGTGLRWCANTAVPKNSEPRITPIHTRVVAALRASGLRNAGTPLETASVPVRAMAPDEKGASA